jgi:hypothetical protein
MLVSAEVRVSSIVRYKGDLFTAPAAPVAWPNAVHLRWSWNVEDFAGYTTANPLLPRLFYVVTAVDQSNNESAFSAEIRGKAPPSLH